MRWVIQKLNLSPFGFGRDSDRDRLHGFEAWRTNGIHDGNGDLNHEIFQYRGTV